MTENMNLTESTKIICSSFISEAGKFSYTWAKNINALVPSFSPCVSLSSFCALYCLPSAICQGCFLWCSCVCLTSTVLTMLLASRVHGMNTSYLVQDITNYENDPSKFVSPSKQASHILNGDFTAAAETGPAS